MARKKKPPRRRAAPSRRPSRKSGQRNKAKPSKGEARKSKGAKPAPKPAASQIWRASQAAIRRLHGSPRLKADSEQVRRIAEAVRAAEAPRPQRHEIITGKLASSVAQDTAAATGSVETTGTLASTEALDTAAMTGLVESASTLASTEAPDTAVMIGRKRKRAGGGRKPALTPEEIERGIGVLRSKSKMTVEAARATLRAEGILGSDSVLYKHIVKPANKGISK